MSEVVYTLKKKKGTEELHIFKGRMTQPDRCNANELSICKEMKKEESIGDNIFACESEHQARISCAGLGRSVCGTCVSDLYLTK